MIYKCDSCLKKICEPPSQEEPHGAFFCSAGHWNGEGEDYREQKQDSWKWCRDYEPEG